MSKGAKQCRTMQGLGHGGRQRVDAQQFLEADGGLCSHCSVYMGRTVPAYRTALQRPPSEQAPATASSGICTLYRPFAGCSGYPGYSGCSGGIIDIAG
jgi:hypothetical protein